jgi:hypothetical protein
VALAAGDLVQYKRDPGRWGVVLHVNVTNRNAVVCEVVILYDSQYPQTVGEKRYTHIDYWQKIPQKSI